MFFSLVAFSKYIVRISSDVSGGMFYISVKYNQQMNAMYMLRLE